MILLPECFLPMRDADAYEIVVEIESRPVCSASAMQAGAKWNGLGFSLKGFNARGKKSCESRG